MQDDVTYDVWHYETKCIVSVSSLSQPVMLQIIRRSLRGSARQLLIPLVEKATMMKILWKRDTLFGNVTCRSIYMVNKKLLCVKPQTPNCRFAK